MKLIIVDDELWSRRLIRKLLPWTELGFTHITEAENGEQAIKCINKDTFDLMITDMRMPGIDGAKLLEYIQSNDVNIEIIVMSGYEDYKYLHAALKTKAIDYLLKPIIKEELKKAVTTGIHRITKNKTVQYAEKISSQPNLKEEINQYYHIRVNIINSVIKREHKLIEQHTDTLIHKFFKTNQHPDLTNYILSDMRNTITELEEENKLSFEQDIVFTPDLIKDKLLRIVDALQSDQQIKQLSCLLVQKYISTHLGEQITLSSLADTFHVSKEHLARLFKQEVGVSVQAYITEQKMIRAKHLLLHHDSLAVSTISIMCGYPDIHYFYRKFKKITGTTPIKFRQEKSI